MFIWKVYIFTHETPAIFHFPSLKLAQFDYVNSGQVLNNLFIHYM